MSKKELRENIIWGIVIAIVVVLVLSLMTAERSNPRRQPPIETIPLYSLTDDLLAQGSYSGAFSIGRAYVGQNMYYIAMLGDEQNGYSIQKYDASVVKLFFDEEISPYYCKRFVEYDITYFGNGTFGKIIRIPLLNKYALGPCEELHVPRGTLIQKYSIDLE